MTSLKFTPDILSLAAANVVPLALALMLGWDVMVLILVYWMGDVHDFFLPALLNIAGAAPIRSGLISIITTGLTGSKQKSGYRIE